MVYWDERWIYYQFSLPHLYKQAYKQTNKKTDQPYKRLDYYLNNQTVNESTAQPANSSDNKVSPHPQKWLVKQSISHINQYYHQADLYSISTGLVTVYLQFRCGDPGNPWRIDLHVACGQKTLLLQLRWLPLPSSTWVWGQWHFRQPPWQRGGCEGFWSGKA